MVLVIVVLARLTLGSKPTTLTQVFDALGGHADPYLAAVFDARYQRTLLGIAVGAALAVAGTLMQSATGWVASWAQSQGIEPYQAVMTTIALSLALGSSALRWLPAPPLLQHP